MFHTEKVVFFYEKMKINCELIGKNMPKRFAFLHKRRNFVVELKNIMTNTKHDLPVNNTWQGRIACQYVDHTLRPDTAQMKTSVNSHVYCLVEQGWAVVQFGKNEVKITASEFIIFPPHIPPMVLSTSEDYKAICLVVSSDFILDCPSARYVSHTTTYSLLHESSPCMQLTPSEFSSIQLILKMILARVSSPNNYTADALTSLFGLLLSELMSILETTSIDLSENQSNFKLFVEFNKLLLSDFCEHHEVSFYAKKMGISTRYLSMVVKQVSHTTVATYINQHLMLEACWLLKTSDYSIQEISERLHFADQASFSKFFKRQNGRSPLQYRREDANNHSGQQAK